MTYLDRLRWLVGAVAACVLLGACSVVPRAEALEEPSQPSGENGAVDWLAPAEGPFSNYIATASAESLAVYDAPLGTLSETLAADPGRPLVLALTERPRPEARFAPVMLPGRPNGRTGWIDLDDVDVTWTNYRIRIEVGARTLTLYDRDETLFQSTIAVGTDANPTPLGTTYVAETLVNPDAGGLYGPYALGLALWSETLTEYAGGDGQVVLHGTARPDLLGTAVSHGCVRVHNDVIRELAGRIPLGTPVDIVS